MAFESLLCGSVDERLQQSQNQVEQLFADMQANCVACNPEWWWTFEDAQSSQASPPAIRDLMLEAPTDCSRYFLLGQLTMQITAHAASQSLQAFDEGHATSPVLMQVCEI